MSEQNEAPKVHPATREMAPDDPLELTAFEVPGDNDLMLRLLVEECAGMGWGLDVIMRLAEDPFYQGLYGLLQRFGEKELRRRVAEIIASCGVMRVKCVELDPKPNSLVELTLP